MSIPVPKVEHHEGRGIRSCPIFPELRPILDERVRDLRGQERIRGRRSAVSSGSQYSDGLEERQPTQRDDATVAPRRSFGLATILLKVANLLVESLLTGTDVPDVGSLSNDGTGLPVGSGADTPPTRSPLAGKGSQTKKPVDFSEV